MAVAVTGNLLAGDGWQEVLGRELHLIEAGPFRTNVIAFEGAIVDVEEVARQAGLLN